MKRSLPLFLSLLAVVSGCATTTAEFAPPASDRRVVNIINFVRQCEPRIEWITEDVLYNTVVSQVEMMRRYRLRGTFLLQYDALIDARYQKLFRSLPKEAFELGIWWEIPQPLVEDSGLQWRGRYPWDWHADVGFATGYSPEERVRLVDTYMAKFREVFGEFPKSVGSWFIDAHTLGYMAERYGIVASCNCKDQIGTDGYTLWGGYWNQGYYPSKQNAYMPAQHAANQIPVPIFRMLGSDPIHQYDRGIGTNRQRVISLEPVYKHGGGSAPWCDWYFDTFVHGAAMGYGYVQVGQENSFTWRRMKAGLGYQMPLVARLRDEGKVTVQTLHETGAWFRKTYPVTPPTAVTVLKDHSEKDQKTVWFNSRFYRANLLWDQGTMRFRDIHLFDERIASDYLTQRGTSSRCLFDTLPLVDGHRWSSKTAIAGLRIKSKGREVEGGSPVVDDSTPGQLVVRWPTTSPAGAIVVTFSERTLRVQAEGAVRGQVDLQLATAADVALPFQRVEEDELTCSFRGATYRIRARTGSFGEGEGLALRLTPDAGEVLLDLSVR